MTNVDLLDVAMRRGITYADLVKVALANYDRFVVNDRDCGYHHVERGLWPAHRVNELLEAYRVECPPLRVQLRTDAELRRKQEINALTDEAERERQLKEVVRLAAEERQRIAAADERRRRRDEIEATRIRLNQLLQEQHGSTPDSSTMSRKFDLE